MDFLTTHTNAALSEFEKVSDVTSELSGIVQVGGVYPGCFIRWREGFGNSKRPSQTSPEMNKLCTSFSKFRIFIISIYVDICYEFS